MAALPNGYVDTGLTATFTVSGDVQVLIPDYGDSGYADYALASIGDWALSTNHLIIDEPTCPSGFAYRQSVVLQKPDGTTSEIEVYQDCVELDEFGIQLPSELPATWSSTYSYTQQSGPWRLGVRMEYLRDPQEYPAFAKDYRLVYQWFGDENTAFTDTFGGFTHGPVYPYAAPAIAGLIGGLGWACTLTDPSQVTARFRNLTLGATPVDTSDLADGIMTGLGAGDVDCQGSGTSSHSAALPYEMSEDIDVLKYGQSSLPGIVNDSDGASLTLPVSRSLTRRIVSWAEESIPSAIRSFTIDATWAAAQTPAFPSDDRTILLWGAPARHSPGTAVTDYTPVTVSLDAERNIQRPEGNRPSDWVSSDTGILTVAEGLSTTSLTVSGPGAYVRRQFGASGTDQPVWRKWLGVGTQGKLDPLFNPDLSEKTQHDTGEDIWSWESYGYLRLGITAPETATLTLTVEGVLLEITDSHTTGSDRTEQFVVVENAYTKTYTFSVAAGTNTVDVDLLFPNEGGPWYHGRIDALRLSGWTAGSWSIDSLKLVSKSSTAQGDLNPGRFLVKCAFGPMLQRVDYSALVTAHNGAHPTYALGDTLYKGSEASDYGGALRYVYIITGATTGVITDTQQTLQAFWEQLGNLEGWNVTYNAAAYQDANEDDDGNSLGPELAQWTLPIDQSETVGLTLGVKARPQVGSIQICNGFAFAIYSRDWRGYGAIDAVVKAGNTRAPGESLTLYGQPAVSDAHGFISWKPIPAAETIPSEVTP